MQFVDSLPPREANKWWQIVTPVEEVSNNLDAIREGKGLYLDLSIIRDGKYEALVRILPDQVLGVNRDEERQAIYRIERAKGFFIDLDGEMTDNLVGLRVVVSTGGNRLSYVVMWTEDVDHIADAC